MHTPHRLTGVGLVLVAFPIQGPKKDLPVQGPLTLEAGCVSIWHIFVSKEFRNAL